MTSGTATFDCNLTNQYTRVCFKKDLLCSINITLKHTDLDLIKVRRCLKVSKYLSTALYTGKLLHRLNSFAAKVSIKPHTLV